MLPHEDPRSHTNSGLNAAVIVGALSARHRYARSAAGLVLVVVVAALARCCQRRPERDGGWLLEQPPLRH